MASFKQQCPSCEAQVPIRDEGLIGRKIDCPKCKYRFQVEAPPEEEDEAPAEAEKKPAAKGSKKGKPDADTDKVTDKKPGGKDKGKDKDKTKPGPRKALTRPRMTRTSPPRKPRKTSPTCF